MSNLPFQIERYIVKQLACEEEPASIAESIRSKFLREVDEAEVKTYNPGVDDNALTPDLRDLYQYTRWEYTGTDEEDEDDGSFVSVATTDEVQEDAMHCVDVADRTVILIERAGEYTALDNRCTHQGGSLCDGDLSEDTITCPLHGAEFNVSTGEATAPPATEAVDTYELRVDEQEIEIKI